MGALKQWAMSDVGVAEAERGVAQAQARFNSVCAAAALAVPAVDAATLDEITWHATRDLADAVERLAISRGYDTAYDMATYEPHGG